MDKKSDYLVPAAILAAGILIAGTIIYTNQKSRKEKLANISSQQKIVEITEGKGTILGNSDAKVAIVEFSDFQCPFCGKFYNTVLSSIKEKYILSGKAKMFYRDFAFLGEESVSAAKAARCAGEQGNFWSYHNKLFESQKGENEGTFSDINLKKFAADIGLRTDIFNNCFNEDRFADDIKKDTEDGKNSGVSGTPTVFVGILPIKADLSKVGDNEYVVEFENGTMIVGAQPLKTYEEAIEKYLSK